MAVQGQEQKQKCPNPEYEATFLVTLEQRAEIAISLVLDICSAFGRTAN